MRISQIFLRRGHDDGSAPADSAAGVSPWGDPPRLLTDPATMTPVRDLLMAPPALKPLPTEVAARVRHAVIGVPLIPNTDLNPLHQDSGIGHRDGIGNRDGMDPGDGIPVDPGRGPLDSWVPDSKPLDSSVPHSATWPKPSATRASSSSVPPSQPLWEPARSAPVSGLKLAAVAAGAAMLGAFAATGFGGTGFGGMGFGGTGFGEGGFDWSSAFSDTAFSDTAFSSTPAVDALELQTTVPADDDGSSLRGPVAGPSHHRAEPANRGSVSGTAASAQHAVNAGTSVPDGTASGTGAVRSGSTPSAGGADSIRPNKRHPSGSRLASRHAPANSLREETRLLEGARSKLGREPAAALSLALEHRRRFPRGQLLEQRRMIHLEALLRLGRDAEARTLAQGAGGSLYRTRATALLGRYGLRDEE